MQNINKTYFNDLTFSRLYYFAFMGGWGCVLPFVNLFYISLGFNGKQVGLISSVSAIVGMIASPLWVSEVKRHPHARRILQVALLLGGLGYYIIGSQEAFYLILLIVFFHAMVTSGMLPLSDSMAVAVATDNGAGYGSIRLWGSLGWIASVPTTGWLIAHFGYLAGFIGVLVLWGVAALIVLPMRANYFTTVQADQPKTNLWSTFQLVRQDRTLFSFALTLVIVGFLNSGVLQFENVFLSDLGASKQLISIAGILGAIVELPFMIYADRIARRIGVHRLMLIALSMYVFLRLTVLSLPYIATIMAMRFIGGVAFSFYTICFVGLISSRTKSNETATVLALYTVTIAGLVNIVAAPISGAVFDAIGPRWLYALSAVGYGIGILCMWWARPSKEE